MEISNDKRHEKKIISRDRMVVGFTITCAVSANHH
jgi:hypothetical protein